MNEWLESNAKKAFPLWKMYNALNLHFKGAGYDYHRSEGRVRGDYNTFKNRKDMRFFVKLAQKLDGKDKLTFLVSQYNEGKFPYISELLTAEADVNHKKFIQLKEKGYTDLKKHLTELSDKNRVRNPLQLLFVEEEEFSPFLLESISGKISIFEVIYLDRVVKLVWKWDTKYSGDFIYDAFIESVKLMKGFVQVDTNRVKKELVDVWKAREI